MNARFCLKSLAVFAAVMACGAVAHAQVIYNNASTVGESYARGLSDIISAQGDYNLRTSLAAINMTEAARRDIENREEWTRAYFEIRRINRDYRAQERGPRASMEDLVRYAQMGKPDRLTPTQLDYVTGALRWPELLKIPVYREQRHDIELLFAKRSQTGGLGYDDQTRIRNLTALLLDDLKASIRDLPPADYMAAKRFLESLAYEAQQPVG